MCVLLGRASKTPSQQAILGPSSCWLAALGFMKSKFGRTSDASENRDDIGSGKATMEVNAWEW
jgi:hypothetical protein